MITNLNFTLNCKKKVITPKPFPTEIFHTQAASSHANMPRPSKQHPTGAQYSLSEKDVMLTTAIMSQ